MGLNSEQQIFLTQDDQEAHNFNQFQTKSGESFDFREGNDAAIYEVHKQYKLRSRMVDVSEPGNLKDTKQPKKAKDNTTLIELPAKTNPNLTRPMVEDISDLQPSNNQPSTSFPPKENVNNPPENNFKSDLVSNSDSGRQDITENTTEKENLVA